MAIALRTTTNGFSGEDDGDRATDPGGDSGGGRVNGGSLWSEDEDFDSPPDTWLGDDDLGDLPRFLRGAFTSPFALDTSGD